MRFRVLWVLMAAAAILAAGPAPALAQGAGVTASLSGIVADSSGAVLPGADVEVKNNATGAVSPAVTDGQGRFTVPALNAGTYTVKVSMMGFKTFVAPDVQVLTATPASVRVTLELGELTETVVVTGAAEMVQTQTAAVQTTIAMKQIQALPLVTRTALDFVTMLPGAQTTGTNSRATTINGLSRSSINITLDGVNVQDNSNRGDGFFMYIRPLMDSVEEITVSTSTPGAESAGSGSVQIRMATRAGSNTFSGSVYNTWRNQAGTSEADVMTRKKSPGFLWRLNTPYWFNKRDRPKTAAGDYFIDDVRLQTPGFRAGGPVFKDRLFYFFNLEFFMWPNQIARTRYMANQTAAQGIFRYTANDGTTQQVNLYTLAAANGQVAAPNTTVTRLFADARAAATGFEGGQVSAWDLNTDKFDYSPGGEQFRYFPTLRVDWNITGNHRLTGTGRYNRFESDPDILNGAEPRYPGFKNFGGQWSHRYSWSGALRSTFGKSIVNELRYGFAGGKTQFFTNVDKSSFECTDPGCQGPFNLGLLQIGGGGSALTGMAPVTSPSTRYTPSTTVENTLTWLKGQHTISGGASFTHYYGNNWNSSGVVPTASLGMVSTDPAFSVFGENSGNYPGGINATQAGYARNLYAMLTGRVTQVAASFVKDAAGNYQYLGGRDQIMSYNEVGLFVQDQWRLRPSVTLTGGLRWQLQFPYAPGVDSYTQMQDYRMVYGITGEGNLFKPGTMTGQIPAMIQYAKGAKAFNTDLNNFAPSVGLVWRPTVGNGLLRTLLSESPVFRGGYSVSYEAPGFSGFTSIFGNNPGATRSATRSIALGTLGTDGPLPVLLTQTGRLGPPATPQATYPFTPATSESINAFDPNIGVPYTHQYSFGLQREISKNTAIEIRYVGNMNFGQTFEWNMNGAANWNILENGFYQEFRRAQANLQANIAAGRGNTFAFTGAPGTAPLPIFMAYFHGVPLADARNQNPANYTSANFGNSAWYNSLAVYAPSITGISGTGTSGLQNNLGLGTGLDANRAAAGLPVNFFMANPTVYSGGAFLRQNGGRTKYDALQFELRRRLGQGFLVNGSYALGKRLTWIWPSLRDKKWTSIEASGAEVGTLHAFKATMAWELPFGRGRRWGAGASGLVNALIGGWEIDAVFRTQSGQPFNFGGYKLVGMSDKDLQTLFKFHRQTGSDGKERIYMWPQDVIQNSIIALTQASATSPTGYSGALPTGRYFAPSSDANCVAYLTGDCGQPITRIVYAPWFRKTDLSVVKRVGLWRKTTVEARMDLYNLFNDINFNPVGIGGSALSSWELTSAARDPNASQDAGGRITSFGLRFTW